MTDLTKCPGCGGEADNGHDRCMPPNVYYCTKCNDTPKPDTVEGVGWKVQLRDWWYRVQDDCSGMQHSLPEARRVEIEAIFKAALLSERAKAEESKKQLEKTIEGRLQDIVFTLGSRAVATGIDKDYHQGLQDVREEYIKRYGN